jgi:hypothetical protein
MDIVDILNARKVPYVTIDGTAFRRNAQREHSRTGSRLPVMDPS